MPTAAWIGRKSVARNVVAPASTDVQPAFQISSTSRTLRRLKPARMSSAPSAGIAVYDTRLGKTSTTIAIHRPAKIPAHRERASDTTFTAVALSEPPTGRPWKRPEATLAAPWARKSRDALLRDPSGLGTLWLT